MKSTIRQTHSIVVMALIFGIVTIVSACFPLSSNAQTTETYPVVDTNQSICYDNGAVIECPTEGTAFYGQDAQFTGRAPSYTDNGDGTVTDNVTGLIWQQSPDLDGNGLIEANDKLSYPAATAYCDELILGGADDWQLPTIKQAYSLILFSGYDVSGYENTDTSGLVPFIDTSYFDFAYGDTDAGERVIDSQYASSTLYVSDSEPSLLFGVNLADGRIKGYGLELMGRDKTFLVACVRANGTYGVNDFTDNGDGTITDQATGLMWAQNDSGSNAPDGLNWEEALAYAQAQNDTAYLGYSDWRLPSVKELQSIVDYSRSPDTTDSAAIDPLFNATPITNEAGETDFDFYWSGTTHANWTATPGSQGAYVSFGRALGYMDGQWSDVHGAGAQRSDPKEGDPADYPTGFGPQGDAIRIANTVRLVRDVEARTEQIYRTYLALLLGDTTAAASSTGPVGTETVSTDANSTGTNTTNVTTSPADAQTAQGLMTDTETNNNGPSLPQGPADADAANLATGMHPAATARQQPDLAAAAEELGITMEALQAALGDPSQGPPDFATAAQQLGVTEEVLAAALGLPTTGQPSANGEGPANRQGPANTP